MNSPIDDRNFCQNTSLSSSSLSPVNPPTAPVTKSRRGRKRVTDPVLANELKRHRRSRANDRERTRMRSLNEALEHLRTLLPIDSTSYSSSSSSSTHPSMVEDKLTKIETLRTASEYIRLLTSLLQDSDSSSTSSVCSYNLSHQQTQFYHQNPSYVGYIPSSSYSYYHSYY